MSLRAIEDYISDTLQANAHQSCAWLLFLIEVSKVDSWALARPIGERVQNYFFHDLKKVYDRHPKVSLKSALALLAIIFYGVRDTHEMKKFFGIRSSSESVKVDSVHRALSFLYESGVVTPVPSENNRLIVFA